MTATAVAEPHDHPGNQERPTPRPRGAFPVDGQRAQEGVDFSDLHTPLIVEVY